MTPERLAQLRASTKAAWARGVKFPPRGKQKKPKKTPRGRYKHPKPPVYFYRPQVPPELRFEWEKILQSHNLSMAAGIQDYFIFYGWEENCLQDNI